MTTNSICQGQQVPALWPEIFRNGYEISFAQTSFKWANLANDIAGVTVAIVAISNVPRENKLIYSIGPNGASVSKKSSNINAYLVDGPDIIVKKSSTPISQLSNLDRGNGPVDGGGLIFSMDERNSLLKGGDPIFDHLYPFIGSSEFIDSTTRYCLWLEDSQLGEIKDSPESENRFRRVRDFRLGSDKLPTQKLANRPHSFSERRQPTLVPLVLVPKVSSESRGLIPAGLYPAGTVVSDNAFAIHECALWELAIVT